MTYFQRQLDLNVQYVCIWYKLLSEKSTLGVCPPSSQSFHITVVQVLFWTVIFLQISYDVAD